MSDKKIEELIKEKVSEHIAVAISPVSKKKRMEIAEKLPSAYRMFYEEYKLEEGQLVEWKKGMKNKARPRLREPAIVMEVLESPESDTEKDSGTPYFREPLDMIVGVIEEREGSLLCFHVDKRRFKPLEG